MKFLQECAAWRYQRYDTSFNVEFSLSKINWFSGDPLSNYVLKTELKIR